MYALGEAWGRRTKCFVVLAHEREGVKVDIAVEVNVRPEQGLVRLGEMGLRGETHSTRQENR